MKEEKDLESSTLCLYVTMVISTLRNRHSKLKTLSLLLAISVALLLSRSTVNKCFFVIFPLIARADSEHEGYLVLDLNVEGTATLRN
jgi:hypothetical protein